MRVFPYSGDDNPLKQIFLKNKGPRIHKWHHYFDIYHNHFERFRGRAVRLLEIGVSKGGSLRMWKEYFGEQAQIFGVDIDRRCKSLEEDGIEIIIGDQSNRDFLMELKRRLQQVDILIDDGGHRMIQQVATFETLYSLVNADGVYLVEDLHTSYWVQYEGGLRQPWSFVERAKNLVDSLNAWHSRSPDFCPNEVTRTATGIHFYDSVVVIEKCPNSSKPRASATGYDPFGK